MNKRQSYLSLLFIASIGTCACGMEHDTANPEDAKDQFAILKPELNKRQQTKLKFDIDWYTDGDETDAALSAYNAALKLEVDAHPDRRSKKLVQKRKKLWEKIKELTVDREAALRAVNYISGSEQDTDTELNNPYEHFVTRIHRRDAHITAQEKRTDQLKNQLRQLKQAEAKNQMALGTIAAAIRATENASLERISSIENKANDEIAQLKERIKAISAQRDQDINAAKQECLNALTEHSQTKESAVQIQARNAADQAELERLLTRLMEAKTIPQKDRAKLLAYLESEIVGEKNYKKDLETQIAEIKSEIATATVDIRIDNMRAQLQKKEKELAKSEKILSQLNVALAKAKKSRRGWTNFLWK